MASKNVMYKYRDIDSKLTTNLHFSEVQADGYATGFDKLAAWVDESLEVYRPELSQVLYPMFVHAYLEVVKQKQSMRASEMMRRHKPRFVDAAGASTSISSELADLANVLYPQHLKTHRLAKSVLSGKTTIKLSGFSFQLFFNFLQTNSMWPLLGICNQYLAFDTKDQIQTDLRPLESLSLKDDGDDGLRINNLPIATGLLTGCLEDEILIQHNDTSKGKDTPDKPSTPAASVSTAAVRDDGVDTVSGEEAAGDTGGTSTSVGGGVGPGAGPDPPGVNPVAADSVDASVAMDEGKTGPGATSAPDTAKARKDSNKQKAAAAAKKKAEKEIKDTNDDLALLKGNRIETSRIPLPVWPVQATEGALQQLRDCVTLSPSAQPSCCMLSFPQSTQSMQCAAVTEDVKLVAAGFSDAGIRLYDLAAGPQAPSYELAIPAAPLDKQVNAEKGYQRLWGHNGAVYGLSFSYDNRLLYSCGVDGTVRMWSTEMAANLVVWRGHMLPVWDVSACPLGHWIASAAADWTAKLWCNERLECMRSFAGHQGDVDTIAWHPNAQLLVTGSAADRAVRVWDIVSGDCVRLFSGHSGGVTTVTVSPDGSTLAVGSRTGCISIWDLKEAKRLNTMQLHKGAVHTLTFSRAGQLLASGGADETLCIAQPMRMHESLSFAKAIHQAYPAVASHGPVPYKPISSFQTRNTPIINLKFTRSNLLVASGPRVQQMHPRQ